MDHYTQSKSKTTTILSKHIWWDLCSQILRVRDMDQYSNKLLEEVYLSDAAGQTTEHKSEQNKH